MRQWTQYLASADRMGCLNVQSRLIIKKYQKDLKPIRINDKINQTITCISDVQFLNVS